MNIFIIDYVSSNTCDQEVCKAIARILALALDLDADYFNTSEMLENPIAYMRLLHYEGDVYFLSRTLCTHTTSNLHLSFCCLITRWDV